MNTGRIVALGKEVDLDRRTKKPEFKLGARAIDQYGRPWRYYHQVKNRG